MAKEKLFNYVDLSIPKLINLKRSLDPEKVEDTQKLNPQILHSLQSYIQQNKDKEPEKMHKILDILKNFAFQNNIINQNFNFNTQNLNICGEDVNRKINLLHSAVSNQYISNPINNNINSISGLNSNNPANHFATNPINNNPSYDYNNDDKKSKFIFNLDSFDSIEKKHFYNNVKPHNYKTKPCRKYNSTSGCSRGDFCHFIHDSSVKGILKINY